MTTFKMSLVRSRRGAEVVGSEGLLGFPVPQRHVVAVDRVMEEEDLGGSGHSMS